MTAASDDPGNLRNEAIALLDSLGSHLEAIRADGVGQPIVDDLEEILDVMRADLELLGSWPLSESRH